MDRRHFISKSLAAASILSLSPSTLLAAPWFGQRELLMDPGEIEDARRLNRHESGLMDVAVPQTLWTYEEVIRHLSPFLENKFDAFIFVNTDIRGSDKEFVRWQNLKVVQRGTRGEAVFQRNDAGLITGLSEDAVVWPAIPCSTGPGEPYILTYSGIFRFNHERSRARFYTSPNAPMSWSMYLDFVYPGGREAGLAIHGTPVTDGIGRYRDSQGCVAVYPEDARRIREMLMSSGMWSNDLPAFDRYKRLPTLIMQNGIPKARPGVKGLLILFNGYSNPTLEA